MKVGFIGLGTMGGPMALNARTKGGFDMIVHDLRREAGLPLTDAGARWSEDVATLAREADIVLTSLPGPREAEAVGEVLLANMRAGCPWFDLSTNLSSGNALISCGVANIGMWWRIAAPRWVCAWHKPAAMGRCTLGFNNWEPVLVYGKTVGQTSDVFRAPIIPDESVRGHPCPKPLEWAAKQIAIVPEGTVLDPFMGSGTTLRAAKDLGRKAIGVEIEDLQWGLVLADEDAPLSGSSSNFIAFLQWGLVLADEDA